MGVGFLFRVSYGTHPLKKDRDLIDSVFDVSMTNCFDRPVYVVIAHLKKNPAKRI